MHVSPIPVKIPFLILAALPLAAAEPTLTHLHPVAGQQGTTVAVTASGKFEPWPPQVWVDAPGLVFKAGKTKGKFEVEIAKDAALGPHLVRLFNEQGASAPRYFLVSSEPELIETEPNDLFSAPQKIANLPATIGGRLDKAGDVDSFAVSLQRGQALTAQVEAYVLGSTFDGLLRIVDANGTRFAFNHDGRTLDPLLAWTAPHDGTFVVQLMGFAYPATAAVGMTGGEGGVYRLHLSMGSGAWVTFPEVAVGQESEVAEREPNNAVPEAQSVEFPSRIAGVIQTAGDEDRFVFTAVKQRTYALSLIAAQAGSPLDAWLKVENKDGKELARNDDAAGSRDPRLIWTAPSDGVVTVAIGDLTHHGGESFVYRLVLAEAVPAVTATMAVHSLAMAPGKPSEVKVTVKFANGFKKKLQLVAKDLPEGVTAAEVDVPEKGGEVALKLTAEAEAKAASRSVRLVLREIEEPTEHPVRYLMTTTSENNGVPAGYTELVIDSIDQLWLTVPPAKSEAPQ